MHRPSSQTPSTSLSVSSVDVAVIAASLAPSCSFRMFEWKGAQGKGIERWCCIKANREIVWDTTALADHVIYRPRTRSGRGRSEGDNLGSLSSGASPPNTSPSTPDGRQVHMSVGITRRTSLLRMYAKLAGSTKTVFQIDTVTLPVPNALPSLSER